MSAIEKIEEYSKDIAFEQFVTDSMRKHAITYNIQIIGEAVYNLSKDFKEKHPEIIWSLVEKCVTYWSMTIIRSVPPSFGML